jgi:type I restriction enzyme S subunit
MSWPDTTYPVVRLRHAMHLRRESPQPDDGIVTAFRDGQVTLRSLRRTEGFTEALQEIGYQRVHRGDLVIHAMDAFAGAVGVSERTGKCSPVCQVLAPGPATDARYVAYVLREASRSGYIQSLVRGIRERSTDFRWQQARDVLVPAPALVVQRRIADFLDRQSAQLALLSQRARELGQALEEAWSDRLEATMHSEVTRRLRHWGAQVQLGPFGSALKADEYVTGAVPLINPVHIHWRGLRPDAAVSILESRAESLSRWRLAPGEVVLARRGELGRSAAVQPEQEGYVCGTGSAIVRPGPALDPDFLVLYLLTRAARDHLFLASSGSTMPNLDTDALLDLHLPVLTRPQQAEAVRQTLSDRASVDAALQRVNALQTRLSEYRDALVADAVAGRLVLDSVAAA